MTEVRVNIIDADSIIYIVTHNKKDTPEKTIQDCKTQVQVFMNSLFQVTDSTHYLMYLTVGTSFRKQLYPDYKANREKRELPKYFQAVKEYLIQEYKAQYDYNRLEADDLCLITRKNLEDKGVQCFISSPDQDLTKLEGTSYDYKKNIWISTSEEEAKIKFYSDMCAGQSADSVHGLPGVGIKGAEKILQNQKLEDLCTVVFNQYISYFGEHQGTQEFYKNYTLLRILDTHSDINLTEPLQVKYKSI